MSNPQRVYPPDSDGVARPDFASDEHQAMIRYICDRLPVRCRLTTRSGDVVYAFPLDGEEAGVGLFWFPDTVSLEELYWAFRDRFAGSRHRATTPWDDPGCSTPTAGQDTPRVQTSGAGNADLMTVREAAARLNCSISFVYKLMRDGRLAHETRGRRKLPTAASVADCRARSTVPATLPPSPQTGSPRPAGRYRNLFR